MKKIFIVNTGTELGGIEKSLIDFLEFLIKEGYEIDLALWQKRGPLFDSIPKGVNIIENIGVGSFSDVKKKRGRALITSLLRYCVFRAARIFGCEHKVFSKMKREYDIAISYTQDGYSPYFVIDKVKAGKKYLWYHHGAYTKALRAERIDRSYYAKYDKVITVSNANRDMLKQHFPDVDIAVIPNLINEDRIRRLADEPMDAFLSFEGLKICTVGRICKEKGQTFSLEVAKILKERGVSFRWIFVGGGADLENCQSLAGEYGLSEECVFVGAKDNPYPYMKQADIYVQTSYVESECITVKEAMLLGKFVVASDLPALRETLSVTQSAIMCEMYSSSFVECIEMSLKKCSELLDVKNSTHINKAITYKLRDLLGD